MRDKFFLNTGPVRMVAWSVFLVFLLGALPVAAQSLRIDPSVSIPTDFQFIVQVDMDCLGAQVKGVETTIAFDPFLVRLDSITPGPWFTDAPGGFFFWDYTSPGAGAIHFTGSLLDTTSDADVALADCHFSAVGYGQVPLVFQDVDVRDIDNMNLGFGHSTGDLIILDSAVRTRELLFGTLKAIYR